MTLRRREDITDVGAATLDINFFIPQGCVYFADTNKTFRWFVYSVDTVGAFAGGTLAATPVENPGAFNPIGINQMGTSGYLGLRKPVQYNNILYWPAILSADGSAVGQPVAWDGITPDVREAGIDVQNHGSSTTTFTINVAGAGALTFTTGRKYTYTVYDSVNLVESMPANDGITLRTVDTGAIAAKSPVVTLTYVAIDPNIGNVNNNHDKIRFYATTDGGSTYYFHSEIALAPDANTVGATAVLTDSMTDAVLATGSTLVFNSPPPPAKFMAKFQDKLVAGGALVANASVGSAAGEQVRSNVLYYSYTDEPEHWQRNTVFNTQFNAVPFKDQDGEVLLGAIQVNRVLLVGLEQSVWTINNLPIVGVDPVFDFSTLKDRVAATHGFVSIYCYTSLQLTDDEDAAFYVSQRGFHLNNGAVDKLISGSIKWDKTVYNSDALPLLHVINDTDSYHIIVGFASVDSDIVDSAYVYHYHPSHRDENGVGKITGPWDYKVGCTTLVSREDNTREVWGISSFNDADNTIIKIDGNSGQDYTGDDISVQFETGWMRLADDAAVRLRELNITIEEADSASLALGDSTLPQVIPQTRFLMLNSSGSSIKMLWDNDAVTVKQLTGSGGELAQSAGTISIASTDRAIVSISIDAEVYGEEKTLLSGTGIIS
jgi:hypothetical protein